nr:N-acetylmuramoyl-L-alanine amidase [Naumannella cuiyingiana]
MLRHCPPPSRHAARVIVAALLGAALVAGLVFAGTPLPADVAAAAPPTRAKPVKPRIDSIAIPAAGRTERQAGKRPVVAELRQRATERFSTFGVTWDAGPAPAVDYRVRRDGKWTDWAELPIDDATVAGGEEGTRPGSAPVYVGSADGVDLRVRGERAPSGLRADLIDAGTTAADANPETLQAPSGAPVPTRPAIVSRAGWGADESLRTDCGKRYGTTVRGAVVHHTEGSNSYSSAEAPGVIRGIYAYHVQSRGYCDIAYNFLTDRYGKIYEGRAGGVELPVHGGHAREWNTDTVGVAMMGSYVSTNPPTAALDATARIIAWKLAGNYRNPKGTVTLAGKQVNVIFTHGDVVATDCPGAKMQAQMPAFRDRVAALADYRTGSYEKWRSLGGESGWVGSPFRLERRAYGGAETQFAGADILGKDGRIHAVRGSIRTRYRQLGSGASFLGFPITDEIDWPGGKGSRFASGGIYWSATTNRAIEVRSGINGVYVSGDHPSQLRQPTATERASAVAGVPYQQFEKGRIYWSNKRGYAVYGSIYRAYADLGHERSRLGLPTSSEFDVSGGRANNFVGGRITWNRSTDRVTVTYN